MSLLIKHPYSLSLFPFSFQTTKYIFIFCVDHENDRVFKVKYLILYKFSNDCKLLFACLHLYDILLTDEYILLFNEEKTLFVLPNR